MDSQKNNQKKEPIGLVSVIIYEGGAGIDCKGVASNPVVLAGAVDYLSRYRDRYWQETWQKQETDPEIEA